MARTSTGVPAGAAGSSIVPDAAVTSTDRVIAGCAAPGVNSPATTRVTPETASAGIVKFTTVALPSGFALICGAGGFA